MRFGLEEHIITELNEVFEANPKVDKAFIFGSRAKGNYRPDSDIDIAIKGAEITLDDILKMQVAFEEKGINFKIDLVHYDTIKEKALKEHIERVAMVMYSRWNEFKLQEITEPLKDVYQPNRNDDFKYVGLEHIQPETLRLDSVGVSSDVTSNKFRFRKGDVLFGKLRPYFRKVVRPEFDGICSTDIWVFRAKNGFDQSFLFYFLANWDFVNTADGAESGTRMPRADWNFLKDTIWNIPPHPEQAAISEILSSLDDKIDLLHRQNKTLEQLAETLFRQWFVEEAEESWEVGTIEDVVLVKGGTTPSTSNPDFWDGEIYWTSPRDLANNASIFLFNTERKITEEGLAQIGSGLLPIGTVLLSSRAPIGYLAITQIPVAINQGYIAIICDKSISNYFMFLWCKANMETIENAGNGSVFQEISKSSFKTLEFVKPPKDKLLKFDRTVEPIFQKIMSNQIQIRALTQLRDALLPKLMSGEIRIDLEDSELTKLVKGKKANVRQ